MILVMFDAAGVLFKTNYSRFYREGARISSVYTTEDDFANAYRGSRLEQRAHVGEISTHMFLYYLKKDLHLQIPDKEVSDFAMCFFDGPIEETVGLKRKIYNSGHAVGLIPNTRKLVHDYISARHPEVYDTYEPNFPFVASYRQKVAKPDPCIYGMVNGNWEKIIYIEDKLSYMLAAVDNNGWKGILFTKHIDASEMMRSFNFYKSIEKSNQDSDSIDLLKDYAIATSVDELVESLDHYGVKLG
jgi:FMN phosphatase YigB (HAD superfamily)